MGEFDTGSGKGQPPWKKSPAVAITAIIAGTVVMLACIAACTIVVYVFLENAPW
jgi:hypothetical protein